MLHKYINSKKADHHLRISYIYIVYDSWVVLFRFSKTTKKTLIPLRFLTLNPFYLVFTVSAGGVLLHVYHKQLRFSHLILVLHWYEYESLVKKKIVVLKKTCMSMKKRYQIIRKFTSCIYQFPSVMHVHCVRALFMLSSTSTASQNKKYILNYAILLHFLI